MSNLEHLIENGLSALKRGVSYEKWLKTMKDDVNWQGNENISIEQLWTICQYVIYTWMPSAQPESCGDVISREYLKEHIEACWINGRPRYAPELNELLSWIDDVPSTQSTMGQVFDGDMISRQAAIDMIMGQPPEAHYPSWYAEQIKALPSAQAKIIHCHDCVHYTGKDHSWGVCLIHRGVVTNRHRVCQGIDYCSWAERREE